MTIINYPCFFQSPDGREQIQLTGPSTQRYVRAIINATGTYDYCYYRANLKPGEAEQLAKRYKASTYSEYRALVEEVINFFSSLKELANTIKEKETNDTKAA